MNKQSLPIAFLGTSLSNLNCEDVIKKIFFLLDEYKKDLQPRYIATINVDFLVNANKTNYFLFHDSELIEILRKASLATIDGMPIIWSCKLLDVKIQERVTGVDLFPALLKELEKNKKSIFLLGGHEKTLQLCKLYLSTEYPNLILSGTASPRIDCDGEQFELSVERDALLVEQINEAKPDFLFINLGSPKQELWYERIKKNLRVPISMGIGGTLDLFTEMIPRAPLWMQKGGLEWLYRLTQEPHRLWKRYMKDIIIFPLMVLPAIFYHNINKLIASIQSLYSTEQPTLQPRLFLSSQHSLSLINLPLYFQPGDVKELKNSLDDLFNQDALILDFKLVRHLSLESIALLLQISQKAWKNSKPLFFINVKLRIKILLSVHKFRDILDDHICKTLPELLKRLHLARINTTFYDSIQQVHHKVIVSFLGNLDQSINQDDYFNKIIHMMVTKDCVFDFSYCTHISPSEIGLLQKLKKFQEKQDRNFKMQHMNSLIKQKLKGTSILN